MCWLNDIRPNGVWPNDVVSFSWNFLTRIFFFSILKFPTILIQINYSILSSIVRTFYMENDAEIFPAHYTWKVAEKGFNDE